METALAIFLLLTFIALVVYLVRGGNIIVGFFVMILIWGFAAGSSVSELVKIISDRIDAAGSTILIIIFGSWFGRILVDTNIVGVIIRKTVELGGDRPKFTVILLYLVSSAIFTSVYGIGTAMAIGLITMPIMFSLGIPKDITATCFIMADFTGMLINPTPFAQLKSTFEAIEYHGTFLHFALCSMGIAAVIFVLMVMIRLRKGKVQHAWAAKAPSEDITRTRMFPLAYITPIIPVILVAFFSWPVNPALILSLLLALTFSGKMRHPKECLDLAMNSLRESVRDIAILILLMCCIWCYASVAKNCAFLFQPYVMALLPDNPLYIALAVGILAPLGLFRGPLALSGVGTAVVAILVACGKYDPSFTAMLIFVPWLCMTFGTCPTQSTNAWVLSYTKVGIGEHLKSTLPWTWICAIFMSIAMYYFFIG
ncbi:MAG: hypothetical protein AB7D36_06295 [Oscillospiraceae bacterium]